MSVAMIETFAGLSLDKSAFAVYRVSGNFREQKKQAKTGRRGRGQETQGGNEKTDGRKRNVVTR